MSTNAQLKAFFETGDTPTEVQFADLIDSSKRVIYVDDYGAVGDGVTDDTVAIQAAITAATNEGTIALQPDKTYIINGAVTLTFGLTIIGNGSVLKRSDETVTTTTATVADQATTIEATSVAGLAVGDKIILLDTTSPFGGAGVTEVSNALIITNITSLTITVDVNIELPTNLNLDPAGEYPIGVKLLRVFEMFKGGGTTSEPWKIDNVKFDGNRANNDSYHGWVYQRCIQLGGPPSCIITRCHFYEMPGECIFPNRRWIVSDCLFHDLNGSAVHISDGLTAPNGEADWGRCMFVNNQVWLVCEIPVAEQGHNEGAITFSAKATNVLAQGNQFHDCAQGAFGKLNDANFVFDSNILRRCESVGYVNTNGGSLQIGLKITNNYIEDCNYFRIYWANNTIEGGLGIDMITISNNTFINTKISIWDTSNLTITGNIFKAEDAYAWPALSDGMISFRTCMNVVISDNVLQCYDVTQQSHMEFGIIVEEFTPLPIKSDISTETIYAYGARNFTVRNNQILGFGTGIHWQSILNNFNSVTSGYIACTIDGNTIVTRDDADGAEAMVIGPGMIAKNNYILSNSNPARAVMLVCVQDASFNGPIFMHNVVMGSGESIEIATVADTGNGYGYGAIVRYNQFAGAVDDNSGGNSTVSNNDILVSEQPIVKLPREDTGFY